MLNDPLIEPSKCDVYLASPIGHEQCVVLMEHEAGCLMVVSDERLDGEYIVEFPNRDEGRSGWRVYLKDLRALLDRAEGLLAGGEAR